MADTSTGEIWQYSGGEWTKLPGLQAQTKLRHIQQKSPAR